MVLSQGQAFFLMLLRVEGISVSSSNSWFYKITLGMGQHDDKSLLSFPCVQSIKTEIKMGLVRGKLPSVQDVWIFCPDVYFSLYRC